MTSIKYLLRERELVYNATMILNVGYINVLGQYAHLSKLIYLNSSQIFSECETEVISFDLLNVRMEGQEDVA